MSAETWIVRTDTSNPWGVAGHRPGGYHGGTACHYGGGLFRELAPDELPHYRPCGGCLRAEHDGPIEWADGATTAIREAATAVGNAAATLGELGYARMAKSLRRQSENLFRSAKRAEVDS